MKDEDLMGQGVGKTLSPPGALKSQRKSAGVQRRLARAGAESFKDGQWPGLHCWLPTGGTKRNCGKNQDSRLSVFREERRKMVWKQP